jgi:GalNAc-alpha-(1->4)-GalNAc-alpha-(1->3)-diNAcBac-PP-undecaprenol alpha-1,4-N-acetyl-D-galactosaminyltransferase
MPKRVTIVINSLVQGGAQKSAVLLAKELSQCGNMVQFLTFYPEHTDFFEVSKGVEVKRLIYPFQENSRINAPFRVLRVLLRWHYRIKDLYDLRKILKEFDPDLVITFEAPTSVITFMALQRNCPMIASERVHPGFHRIPRWAELLRPFVYRSKNVTLHCQGEMIADWISEEYGKTPTVIPNFLGPKLDVDWKSDSKKIKIFSRYSDQKGIDLAITAWGLLPSDLSTNYTLEIFGDGDRSKYQEIVDQLNLADRVKLNGATKNIVGELSDCLIFLLPSRFEGFPNALSEAISAGVPSIATDCPSAIRELTSQGRYANLIAPKADQIAIAITQLISDKERLSQLNSTGHEIQELFNEQKVLDAWMKLVQKVIARSKAL